LSHFVFVFTIISFHAIFRITRMPKLSFVLII